MRILVTNDDGVHAEGLHVLAEALRPCGEVLVVAPDHEQSAASHALTLNRPLRVRRVAEGFFSVDGTPTDCVLMAVRGVPEVFHIKPELVVSGINHGPNLGDDVGYSGTVAAALEGSILGIPALAVSLASNEPRNFAAAGRVVRSLVEQFTARRLPLGTVLNVNVPDRPYREILGVRPTRLGKRVYEDVIIDRRDPRGKRYYWIGGSNPTWDSLEGSDSAAVLAGYVSITPLQLDLTDYRKIGELEAYDLKLPPEE